MGQGQGTPGGFGKPNLPGDRKQDGDNKKDKKFEPSAPPSRVGRKQRKQKGPEAAARLPVVTPLTKCKLRLLKLERIKDYLLMEEEFVANQERLKPHEEKSEEDRSKVDDLRGSPMSVGNLEELIDENHAIVSSSVGPEYYVDKDQLEPVCAILMHNKIETERAVLGTLISVFSPMMDGLNDTDESDRHNSSWDVKIALDYRDLLRRIIRSVLDSCAAGLKELDGP